MGRMEEIRRKRDERVVAVRELVADLLMDGRARTFPEVARHVGSVLGWDVTYTAAVKRLERDLAGWGAIVFLRPDPLVGNYRGRPPKRMRLNRSYLKALGR